MWVFTVCCSMQPAARLVDGHMVCTWPDGLVPATLTGVAALICLRHQLKVLCLLPSLCCAAYVSSCLAISCASCQGCDEVALRLTRRHALLNSIHRMWNHCKPLTCTSLTSCACLTPCHAQAASDPTASPSAQAMHLVHSPQYLKGSFCWRHCAYALSLRPFAGHQH